MKKNIIKVSFLIICMIIISTITLLSLGKTYTIKYNIPNKEYKFYIDNNKGNVEVIKQQRIDNKLIVKVKALKEGKVYPTLQYADEAAIKILYIHKTKIITEENFFGYSNGSIIVPILFIILLIYILYLLIKKYKKETIKNLYQYKNIAYLGIIIFTFNFIIDNILSINNYRGISDTIRKMINSTASLSYILLPIAFITFILVTISNIWLIKKEGKSLKNLLGIFLGLGILLLTELPNYIYSLTFNSTLINVHNMNTIGPYLYDFIESLIYLIVAYLECVLLGTIIISIKAIKKKINYNKDYIIILGCKIKEDGTLTPLLKGRVDRAIDFRNNQLSETGKDLIFIPSGGKGIDETISEAEAMKNYLLQNGIKKENILVENKSTNTYENIKNSYKLIKNKNKNIIISTTNYHVLRACLLASKQGIKVEGIGSKTKIYFWINAFIREFIGTIYTERKKHLILFILITISLIIMIAINYYTYNL